MTSGRTLTGASLAFSMALAHGDPSPYPWLGGSPRDSIARRYEPPPGFSRLPASPGSFGAWLRGLPLKPGRPPVFLYDGRRKEDQEAHDSVVDIDVGRRDLQQCADAVVRLRAEYLRSVGKDDAVCFRFTNGTPARWAAWRDGLRPQVRGHDVTWTRKETPDGGCPSFRRYLDVVFAYAGSSSLAKDLAAVPDPRGIEAGDVFVQGGFPGHAVIVVDVAGDASGHRAALLAQSYMPAQDIHVLRNPQTPDDPWYPIGEDAGLVTPEWTFPPGSLRRFTDAGCP